MCIIQSIVLILPLSWFKRIFLTRNACYCLKKQRMHCSYLTFDKLPKFMTNVIAIMKYFLSQFNNKNAIGIQKKEPQDHENPLFKKIILKTT